MIDSSGSIRDANPPDGSADNWMMILTFVRDVIEAFTIGEQDTRVGLVRFSNDALFTFPLDEFSDKMALQEAVLEVGYIGGTTNTAAALQLTRTACLSPDNGERPGVDNLVIVITDGLPTVFDLDLDLEIASLKRVATVIAVGITDMAEESLLRDLSSPPQQINQNYFAAPDFASLDNILRALIIETCRAPDGGPAQVTPIPPKPKPQPRPGNYQHTHSQLSAQTFLHSFFEE